VRCYNDSVDLLHNAAKMNDGSESDSPCFLTTATTTRLTAGSEPKVSVVSIKEPCIP
jgi:hypothetical protein